MNNKTKSILIIILILLVDQLLKIWIKTHMMLGDEIVIFKNWFIIHFVENNGMAFGFEFGNSTGKYFLSIFRSAGSRSYRLVPEHTYGKRKVPFGLIVSFSLIMAGAIGNILDSAYFGLIFDDSYGKVSALFPPAWRLCTLFTRPGGRYVLFPADFRSLPFMVTFCRWTRIHLFPSCF